MGRGDVPAYFSEKRNLFGSYLSGKTPELSWDERHEQAILAGGHAVSPPVFRRRHRNEPKIVGYLRSLGAPSVARLVLTALAHDRGVPLRSRSDSDPYALLATFLRENLSSGEQHKVLERLREVVDRVKAEERGRIRTAAQRGPNGTKPRPRGAGAATKGRRR
jgi:hypothetical protein